MPTSAKTIILTGASRGIGWEIAQCLLREPLSCNLVAVARSREPLQKLKEQYPGQVEVLSGDVTDYTLAEEAVELGKTAFGRIDGLVVNHGVLEPVTKAAEASAEDWKKGFDINVFSAVEWVKAVIPELRQSKGKVIFTSSGAATSATTGWGMYGASKAALNHFNMTIAREEPDITCVSIRPGMVDTEMQGELRAKHLEVLGPNDGARFVDAHKEGKLLPPEKPGRVIAKLAANAPPELSGKFLTWNVPELADFQE